MRAKYPASPVQGEMLQRDDAQTFEAATYAKVCASSRCSISP